MGFASLVEEQKERDSQDGWFPPGWNFNGYTIELNLRMARTIRDKKKSLHTQEEKKILKNEQIIRSCYQTPESELKLSKYLIGPFDLDPYYNPYAKTAKYGSEKFTYFDGNNADGFNIELWKKLKPKSIWVNAPFNRLKEAATCVEEYFETEDSSLAFICNLDRTSYFDKFLKIADLLIIADRVKFVPIPGLKVSQPTNSSAIFVFNPIVEVPTGPVKLGQREYYCVNLRNKEIFEIADN